MESIRELEQQNARLSATQAGRNVRRLVAWLGAAAAELLGSKSFLMAAGGFTMMLTGAFLNSATTAFFTGTQTVANNTYVSGTISLGAPTFTAFSVTKAVPGDMFSRTITLQNTSNMSVPYYLTTFATGTSALDTDTTNGLRLVLLRCGTEAAPVDCTTATSFQTVRGVMDTAAAVTVTTTGGAPTAAGVSMNGSTMVFTTGQGNVNGSTQDVASVPVLTKNNPNTQGRCSTASDGGCLLGGAASSLSNPATSVTSGGGTMSIPALSSVNGLAASATDRFLAYVVVPSGANNTVQTLSTTLTFAFTAVQPSGTLDPSGR